MRLAVISDIHGNSWALEAVLKDVERHRPEIIVNLGDSLYGPLKPMDTFQLLKSREIISISGNEDRLIIDQNHQSSTLDYVINDLNDEALVWLRSLKSTHILDSGIFLCHGTPSSDSNYLLEELYENHINTKNSSEIDILLELIDQKIVLCGHSHLSKVVQTQERIIINPGSVGCPAFDDDIPIYHKVENHSNYARYCIVKLTNDKVLVDEILVPYNFTEAVNCALKNNRPDWAKWLETGLV